MKKLFRKSLILFVQLTYGANINRKIRETIYWILNDEIVSYFIKQVKDSIWKENISTGEIELIKYESHTRTDEEKIQTKLAAKQKVIENIPGLNILLVQKLHKY